MIHTPILPVIIPLIAGFTLLLIKRFGLKTHHKLLVIIQLQKLSFQS